MSSSPSRDPLPGIIRQNKRIVGPILLPESDQQEFIDQFNNCYGPLQLHIDPKVGTLSPRTGVFPVGARRAPTAGPVEPKPEN